VVQKIAMVLPVAKKQANVVLIPKLAKKIALQVNVMIYAKQLAKKRVKVVAKNN